MWWNKRSICRFSAINKHFACISTSKVIPTELENDNEVNYYEYIHCLMKKVWCLTKIIILIMKNYVFLFLTYESSKRVYATNQALAFFVVNCIYFYLESQ